MTPWAVTRESEPRRNPRWDHLSVYAATLSLSAKTSIVQPLSGPVYVERSRCDREVRALDVPEPEELTQRPDDDKKLSRDSYLSPTFLTHVTNW